MKFFKTKVSKVMFCLMLGLGTIAGAPLNPDEIDELLAAMSTPKVAHTLSVDADTGDDPFRLRLRLQADLISVQSRSR